MLPDNYQIVTFEEKYLPELARIFVAAFDDGVLFFSEVEDTRVKTTRPDNELEPSSRRKKLETAVRDILKLFGQVFSDGFLVAVDENDKPQGFIIVISGVKSLWKEAAFGGHLFRYLRRWLQGQYGLTLFDVGKVIYNKIYYIAFSVRGTAEAQILSLAVSPEAQGQGLGSSLTGAGLEYLRDIGIKKVKLEVRPDNPAARHIYEKHGFKVVGKAKDLHDDWYVMEADLTKKENYNKEDNHKNETREESDFQ